jgi:tripartite-type tricarboxylate transporter receptor subunit TctC
MDPRRFTALTDANGNRWVMRQEKRPGQTYGREFVTVFVDDYAKLGMMITRGTTLRVLMMMPLTLRVHCWLPLNQAALANVLKTTQPNISTALRELLQLGALERKRENGVLVYRLPETWLWRGTVGQYHQRRRERAGDSPPVTGGGQGSTISDARQMDIAAVLPPPWAGEPNSLRQIPDDPEPPADQRGPAAASLPDPDPFGDHTPANRRRQRHTQPVARPPESIHSAAIGCGRPRLPEIPPPRRLEPTTPPGGIVMLRIVAAVVLALAASVAQAQPADRPLRIIVPFTPAGTSDIIARIMADAAAPSFPRGIVVENRPGAGGQIGVAEAARAAPDGTTLLQCAFGPCGANPGLYPNAPFDLLRDFRGVIVTAAVRNVMTVRKDLPAQTLAEFIALARATPGGLTYASSGVGASNHLAPELFRGIAGFTLTHVPYRGSGPAITDLVGGRVDIFFDNLPSILPHIREGRARALAAASAQRIPQLPDLATFGEQGVAGMVIDSWFGFIAPAATPDATIAALNAAFARTLADPAVRARIEQTGAIPLGGTAAEADQHMQTEVARWGKVVREANIRAE